MTFETRTIVFTIRRLLPGLLVPLAVALTAILAGCGDDSPGAPDSDGETDTPLPERFTPAATPEEFVDLLEKVYNDGDLELYELLLDPDYRCENLLLEPGQPASWDREAERAIARRIFAGGENLTGYHVSTIAVGFEVLDAAPDTSASPGGNPKEGWWTVEVALDLTVLVKPTSWDHVWHGQRWPSFQRLVLKPHPTIDGHLVMRSQEDRRIWSEDNRPVIEQHFWSEIKAAFLDGIDTPESFFRRFARNYGIWDRDAPYKEVLSTDFRFHPLPQDARPGPTPYYTRSDELAIAERMTEGWMNNVGWTADSFAVTLNPTRVEELIPGGTSSKATAGTWEVDVDAELDFYFSVAGSGETFVERVRSPQTFVLRPHLASPRKLLAFEQWEREPSAGNEGATWGFLKAMYLPETPEVFLARLRTEYEQLDSEGYLALLDADYVYFTGSNRGWGFDDEAAITAAMFGGATNRRGERLESFDLGIRVGAVQEQIVSEGAGLPAERWFTTEATCSTTAGVRLPGDATYEYRSAAEHLFEMRPDPDDPVRLQLASQLDPEEITDVFGPADQSGKSGATVELDVDSALDRADEVVDADPGDTVRVDIWIRGPEPIIGYIVELYFPAEKLEAQTVEFAPMPDWETTAVPGDDGILFSAGDYSAAVDIAEPFRVATVAFVILAGKTFAAIEIGAEHTLVYGTDHLEAELSGVNSMVMRLGDPRSEHASWGTVKDLFRSTIPTAGEN